MKKEVKILSLLLIFILSFILMLSGCRPDNTDSSSSVYTSVFTESVSSTESETSALSSETSSQVEETEKEHASSGEPSLSVTSPVKSETSLKPVVSAPANFTPIAVSEYTVNDADNTRGLSDERKGCYFGVAKDGKPHQLSIDNQLWFDSLQNINALALDTVSNDNGIYLTFDCGYEYNNLTASILDTLKAKKVKAAFFCTLSYLKDNPSLIRRMIDEGHIVGNHSATHPDFTTLTRTEMANELYLFEKYLGENFGYRSNYFRFPGGYHSENALELVTSVGYKSIFWSIAYNDWDTKNQPDKDSAFKTITSRYHSGAVILLHAVSETNTNILGSLIDNAHAKGYSFKTLDDYYNRGDSGENI